mmetsp:Transcript_44617/g.108153  ORF Transcript_44617/g.108153 Transcript_44617/m.108153 type:complete len:697 (+) Transcript_44617:238-2328(+)
MATTDFDCVTATAAAAAVEVEAETAEAVVFDVADFDVLSDELDMGGGGDGSDDAIYVLDDYNGQIGNNRLNVLIEMNHEAFSMNFNKNDQDECEKIVDQIYGVTMARGRFLSLKTSVVPGEEGRDHDRDDINRKPAWKILNEEQSKELVRQALRSPLSEREIGEPLDAYANNVDTAEQQQLGDHAEDSFEPLPLNENDTGDATAAAVGALDLNVDDWDGLTSSLDAGIHNLELHDGHTDGTSRLESAKVAGSPVQVPNIPPASALRNSSGSPAGAVVATAGENDKKKRGRRQSLLRRSVSESNFDKKKTYRNLSGEVGLSELTGLQPLPTNQMRRFHSNIVDSSLAATGGMALSSSPPPARGLQRAVTVSSERNIRLTAYNSLGGSATSRQVNLEPISFGSVGSGVGGGLSSSSIPEFSPLTAFTNGEDGGGGVLRRQEDFQTGMQDQRQRHDNYTSAQYSGMDVVLRSDCTALSPKPDIVGNNRLSVMITLKKSNYGSKSPIEQIKLASEIVDVVQDQWMARILVDTGLAAYKQLGYNEAVDAMKTLLLGNPSAASAGMISSSSLLSSTGSSQAAAAMSLASSMSSNSSLVQKPPTKTNNLLAAAPPVPEYLRNASLEILNGGQTAFEESRPEEMQSAAIEALKIRKAKREMSKGKKGDSYDKNRGTSSWSPLSPTPSSSEKDSPERTASSSSSS